MELPLVSFSKLQLADCWFMGIGLALRNNGKLLVLSHVFPTRTHTRAVVRPPSMVRGEGWKA